MRSVIFLFLATVLVGTLADNDRSYIHALQTIFFYLSYRAEIVLPLEDRIVGVRCRDWDNSAKKCREVPGQETYERCKGTQNIRIPGGDLVRGLCSLREFIVHVTGAGSDRTEFDNLSKNGWTNRDAAHTMNENNFGNGKVRPWAVIKDGGTGYISAVKRASGQVAKVRKVASSNPAVWEVFQKVISRLNDVVDDITQDRRVDKDKNLLPILRGNKKSNWGGILPEFDHPPGGGELFNYAKTLDKLQKKFPDERQYKLAKASLDDEIRNFNLKPATSTHNAAERVWDDTKGLMVKDC